MTTLSSLFSQLLVELAGARSPHLFAVACSVIAAGGFLNVAGGRWPPLGAHHDAAEREPAAVSRLGLLKLAALAPLTMICVLQAGITNNNLYVMTPLYGERVGIDAQATVTLITAFSLGSIVSPAPMGWLADRYDKRLLLLALGSVCALCCGSIAWLGSTHLALLAVLFFVYGASAMTIYPVAIALANSLLDRRHMTSASGGFLLLYSFANVLTPAVTAELMKRTAPAALFVLLGTTAALVAVSAGLQLLRRPLAESRPVAEPGP